MTTSAVRHAFPLLFTGLLVACQVSTQPAPAPAAPPPAQCADGPPMCGADRASVVQCQRGMWVLLQPCSGPRGCSVWNNALQCDASQRAQAAQPAQTGPCAEGGYDCTPDRRALTICRGGRMVIASTCRGARGCAVGAAVDCDHSVAAVGDPCESPKEIACSQDGKALLRCAGNTYQFSEPCRNACLAASGRTLCQ